MRARTRKTLPSLEVARWGYAAGIQEGQLEYDSANGTWALNQTVEGQMTPKLAAILRRYIDLGLKAEVAGVTDELPHMGTLLEQRTAWRKRAFVLRGALEAVAANGDVPADVRAKVEKVIDEGQVPALTESGGC